MTFGIFRGKNLYSEKKYYIILCCFWVYTITWVVLMLSLFNSSLSGLVYWILLVVLLITVPSINDLFRSYNKYKSIWIDHNNAKDL